MCFWGEAYAWGPNINAAMEDAAIAPAWAALSSVRATAARASTVEQALVEALGARYREKPVADRSGLDQQAFKQAWERADVEIDGSVL